MTRVRIAGHLLTATPALVWHGDLPRPLQQILFDAADGATDAVGGTSPGAHQAGPDRIAHAGGQPISAA
jgi:hypothetical protein